MTNQKIEQRLPQNMQRLLMEIGEKTVLFRLSLLTKSKGWEVYQNLSEKGCDIILVKNQDKIKIEVKTRQRLSTTSKHTAFSFTLTESEYSGSDFLIAYWYEKNYFFIVSKNNLKKTSSNKKLLYHFSVTERKDGTLKDSLKKHLNRWDLIESEMNKKTKQRKNNRAS